ncbi:MAG: 4Fe-4S dicluster domain-containing protein, partial [Promethearchaeota archaeon]
CENPPCVEVCPVEALTKLDNGIVFLDQEECTGCQACLTACPYEVIVFNDKRNLAEKCNLCSHRIDEGLEPFCVICCEGQAIHFGDLNDPNSKVAHMISDKKTFQLKPEVSPSVYYCPPKPKRRL